MIKKKIDSFIVEHLGKLCPDARYIFTLEKRRLRLTAIQCTQMVSQVKANFGLSPLETRILGQAYVAGGLLSGEIKGNGRIILSIECDGPVKGFSVESWGCGAVRGCLRSIPIVFNRPLQAKELNCLYGEGFLSVTKILEGSREPFKGDIKLHYGDLAKDLALYYRLSEQTPSAFILSLKFDNQGHMLGAGGLFLQALPDCPDETLGKLEDLVPSLPSLGEEIANGKDMRAYVSKFFRDFEPEFLSKAYVGFSCPCARENFLAYLRKLPESEKEAIRKENKFPVKVTCLNCGTEYSFTKEELLE